MKTLLPSPFCEKPRDRQLLVHAHIFKNAGTTIDWILKRNFQSKFKDDRNDKSMLHDPDYFLNIISSNSELSAISSHSFPLPYLLSSSEINFDIYTILFLRNPILRIRSVYHFEKKQNANTPGAIAAKKYNFRDYVNWRMNPSTAPTIRNMQVRYLTFNSLPRVETLSSDHLQDAKSFIQRNPLTGIVESFDQSLVIFEDALLDKKFDIDFAYIRQNSTDTDKSKPDEMKIEEIKNELGNDLYQTVLENNDLDCNLYNFAKKTVISRYNAILNNDAKLKNLHNRCRELSFK